MTIDKKYIDQIIKVSSKAAYSSSLLVGKNDKIAADKAAVDAMRTELNMLDMNGKVVIGEGELDEAPMLYIGEMLGTKKGPNIDIAVDPVEGTNFAAKNLPGALSVIAIAEKGNLFHAPETYMDKIAANVKIITITYRLVFFKYSEFTTPILARRLSNIGNWKLIPNAKINLIIKDKYSLTLASNWIGRFVFEPIDSNDKKNLIANGITK